MPLNATINWSAINNPADLMAIPNQTTGGWFWTGMLYMIYIIFMLIFINFGLSTALLISSVLILSMGLILLYLGLVSIVWAIYFPAGVILLIFLYIAWSAKSDSY